MRPAVDGCVLAVGRVFDFNLHITDRHVVRSGAETQKQLNCQRTGGAGCNGMLYRAASRGQVVKFTKGFFCRAVIKDMIGKGSISINFIPDAISFPGVHCSSGFDIQLHLPVCLLRSYGIDIQGGRRIVVGESGDIAGVRPVMNRCPGNQGIRHEVITGSLFHFLNLDIAHCDLIAGCSIAQGELDNQVGVG